jgi:hypothetical protein
VFYRTEKWLPELASSNDPRINRVRSPLGSGALSLVSKSKEEREGAVVAR